RPLNDPQFPWPTFVLGWPIGAIFFWCTDQTIVQHILGARDLKQGQLGAFFASSLKVMTPLFFFLPGIMCKVLHPNLASEDEAYMTMVTTYLPNGLIGLIVAILIAALVSTIDSALNSFSTIFTLDVYSKQIRPNADPKEIKLAGRIVTASAAVCGIILAIALGGVKGMNLFSLLQTITFSFAPSMAVVFLLGVAWKRANSTGAFLTLIFGNTFTVAVGICYLTKWPSLEFWDHPSRHYLMLAFYNFLIVGTFMIVTTLLTKPPLPEHQLPPIKEAYAKFGQHAGVIWKWWGILAFIMVIVYIIFN
ncbi:MAG: sodium:solute symporter family transporter, partial [Planctomycetota bacterium]